MQCKPVTSLPAGEKWTFEIKFDGYRCVAAKRGTEVTLFRAARRVLAQQALSKYGGYSRLVSSDCGRELVPTGREDGIALP